MKVRRTRLLAALALSVLIAGCGSEDDPTSPVQAEGPSVKTSSLSKEQFIERAGAACSRSREDGAQELNAYAEESEGALSEQAQSDAFKAVIVPMVEREMAAIRRLGAPSGDEKEVEAILIAQREGIDRIKQLKRLDATVPIQRYFEAADDLLLEYGLVGCSRRLS